MASLQILFYYCKTRTASVVWDLNYKMGDDNWMENVSIMG
jgi:uncharacterized protein YpiB (UPF0302 family)